MNEKESSKQLELAYWQDYEKELAPLAAEIKEQAGYLTYDLNPVGRYKEEYAGFVLSALQDIAELESSLKKLKKRLQAFNQNAQKAL